VVAAFPRLDHVELLSPVRTWEPPGGTALPRPREVQPIHA
jgi:hypothetical protein